MIPAKNTRHAVFRALTGGYRILPETRISHALDHTSNKRSKLIAWHSSHHAFSAHDKITGCLLVNEGRLVNLPRRSAIADFPRVDDGTWDLPAVVVKDAHTVSGFEDAATIRKLMRVIEHLFEGCSHLRSEFDQLSCVFLKRRLRGLFIAVEFSIEALSVFLADWITAALRIEVAATRSCCESQHKRCNTTSRNAYVASYFLRECPAHKRPVLLIIE